MRFDLLDEYATLLPYGIGVSRQNRIVHPVGATKKAKPGAIAMCVRRLKILFKAIKAETAPEQQPECAESAATSRLSKAGSLRCESS